ncbi:DUF4097 family beta strand repeat-containing protein [Streptomyces lydicus]|uniref:DUF4097 family beta strand repeat-containing protein n=1 Tax=Streptomyces lydicus TaxID=47763 RepID=UPI00101163C5|nr:DUF4097 family beta strand repeat-containing protein [Streptomyces lydicus]MCZ1012677.1 DUF4097 family beta strand repeat-containing protein [Streptomyces lydicus]
MSTSQTFTATAAGALWTDIISHVGTVNVTIDPTLKNTVVTVSTDDDEGPLADAVRGATQKESTYQNLNCLTVRLPEVQRNTMTMGNSTFSFNGGNMVVGQNFGVVRGSVTGMTISNGDVIIGGRKVVSNGRVVAEQGTVVSGGAMGTITVEVKLPSDQSSVRLETTSADLTVHGDLQVLDVRSVSGDVEARGLHTLRGTTTSGDFEVGRVDARVDVSSVSGDIEIGAYNGTEFRANTVSGDVHVSATPAADGSIDASTVSGDVTTRGTSHLSERVSTVSGKHRRR